MQELVSGTKKFTDRLTHWLRYVINTFLRWLKPIRYSEVLGLSPGRHVLRDMGEGHERARFISDGRDNDMH
jgi:hypothetical protein